jgi:WD40 repeat protein
VGGHRTQDAVAVGPAGQVITGGQDRVVRLWDLATPGRPTQEVGRHDGAVYAVAVGPDRRLVIAGQGVTMFEMTSA